MLGGRFWREEGQVLVDFKMRAYEVCQYGEEEEGLKY